MWVGQSRPIRATACGQRVRGQHVDSVTAAKAGELFASLDPEMAEDRRLPYRLRVLGFGLLFPTPVFPPSTAVE